MCVALRGKNKVGDVNILISGSHRSGSGYELITHDVFVCSTDSVDINADHPADSCTGIC